MKLDFNEQKFAELETLGNKIAAFCRAMKNYRAVVEGREMIANNMHRQYPNMRDVAIRRQILDQEATFAYTAQVETDEMRMYFYSLGFDFDRIDANDVLLGILRKPLYDINKINFEKP